MRGRLALPRATWECLVERAGRPRGLAQCPWVREERQRPLECSVGATPAASPLPSSLELAPLPEVPLPQTPDTGVTSATSWCSAPGHAPGSSDSVPTRPRARLRLPLLARLCSASGAVAGRVGEAWPRLFTWDQPPAQLRLQMQPLDRPAPPPPAFTYQVT